MPRFTAEQIAAKWRERTSAAGQAYIDGVNAVRTNPAAAAANSADLWASRVSEAATKDKFRRSLGRVTLEGWKTAAAQNGSSRLTSGAAAGEGKMAAFQREVASHIDAGIQRIAGMPKTSLDQRIARSAEWQRHMAAFRRGGR